MTTYSSPSFRRGFSRDVVEAYRDTLLPNTPLEEVMKQLAEKFSTNEPHFWGLRNSQYLAMVCDDIVDNTHDVMSVRVDIVKTIDPRGVKVHWPTGWMLLHAHGVTHNGDKTLGENAVFDAMITLFEERILKRLPIQWELSYETIRLWYQATLESEQERERERFEQHVSRAQSAIISTITTGSITTGGVVSTGNTSANSYGNIRFT